MENTQNMQGGKVCKCTHHKTMPILVILFGLLFLLQALGVIGMQSVAIIWPIIVMLAGIFKLAKRHCKCC